MLAIRFSSLCCEDSLQQRELNQRTLANHGHSFKCMLV